MTQAITALMTAKDVRVEEGGASLIDGLSFESDRDHVVLVGNWSPLFRVLANLARVTRGELLVEGAPLAPAVAAAIVGVALHDALLPPDWTPVDYLARSAELIGMRPREARRAASTALELTGIAGLAKRKLRTLDAAGRCAVLITHAALASPRVIILERPLAGLGDDAAAFVLGVIERAVSGRRSVISVAHASIGPERRLAQRAEEALNISRNAAVLRIDVKRAIDNVAALYVVAASRHAPALAEELERRGIIVRETTGAGDSARLLVELSAPRKPDDIVDAAVMLDAPLVEMTPLFESDSRLVSTSTGTGALSDATRR
jgi:ABC-type cobalamin/Fe3+-siderophores transport system ATPase subunit